jgi:hypothetical protein
MENRTKYPPLEHLSQTSKRHLSLNLSSGYCIPGFERKT